MEFDQTEIQNKNLEQEAPLREDSFMHTGLLAESLVATKAIVPFSLRRKGLEQKMDEGNISSTERAELLSLRQFPDNARGRELAYREALGQIEEGSRRYAELCAIRAFPNNERAQELATRSNMNELDDPAEKEELRLFYQEKARVTNELDQVELRYLRTGRF